MWFLSIRISLFYPISKAPILNVIKQHTDERVISTTSTQRQNEMDKLYRVFTTTREMFLDRGYTTLIAGPEIDSKKAFFEMMCNPGKRVSPRGTFFNPYNGEKNGRFDRQLLNYISQDENNNLLMINFVNEKCVGIPEISIILDRMSVGKIDRCILVYPGTITPSAKKYIEKSSGTNIEIFSEDELICNITKHHLMPRHTVLSTTEKEILFSTNNFSENELPRIHLDDPVARYFGMRRGDVVKIQRRSETAGIYVLFRICL